MASVVTRPVDAGAQPAPAGGSTPSVDPSTATNAALAFALAAGFVALAFLTKASFGGASLGANTWTQIALLVLAAGLIGAVAVIGARGRPWGLTTLIVFVALAALTFLSIAWSVQPANSWLEANRTLSYLAAFAGALALARITPGRWPAFVGAIAIASLALSGWALLVKVFPSLAAGATLGRLTEPFGYWNAVGVAAAIGLPGCLWAGARRGSPRVLRTLAVPAIAILVAALVLSYGRGALAAAAIGLALWFVLVPFRLRAALVLILGALVGGFVIAWALAHHALSHDNIAAAARTSAGHTFGIVLVLALAAAAALGYGAAIAVDRASLAAETRRRIGIALIALVALVPVLGVVALADSSRGVTGEISHVWDELTNPNAHQTDTSSRLVGVGSSRPTYWREGLLVGEHALFKGTGAGGFQTASLRFAKNRWGVAAQAHSYVIQTFSDFGLLGLAIMIGLLVAWGIAAARAIGLRPRAGPEHASERVGMITLLAVVVIFGVHSAIDWTWFVPGVAVPVLAAAGWLAGRGPLAEPVGQADRARGPASAPGTYALVTAVVALLLIGAWAIWQPLRSSNADAAALTALSRGDTRAAYADATSAKGYDPVSTDPLLTLSEVYTAAGNPTRARAELLSATSLQPDNPDMWQALGDHDRSHGRPRLALTELRHALALDPGSAVVQDDVAAATAAR